MELTCPKCQGPMRSYERSGIVVDQCTECRGVYLDRGELEKLVDAEGRQVAAAAPAWGSPPPRREERHEPYERYDTYDPRYRKKRKSFLEDLFD